jgi:hypothetical protein
MCVCLLLPYLLQNCSSGGRRIVEHMCYESTTSRGLCGLVCPSHTSECGGGTREELGTLTQGGALFPWFLSFKNRTQNSRVAGWCKTQPPAHRGILSQLLGDLEPTQGGAGTREEPGTLTQGGALFSLVSLVCKTNPKGWTAHCGGMSTPH